MRSWWLAPALGTLDFSADGSFVYTPQAGVSGLDSLSYRAFDQQPRGADGAVVAGDTSSIAKAYITIVPVADRPIARSDTFRVDEDQTLVIAAPGVLGNDSDADADSFFVSQVFKAGFSVGGEEASVDGDLTLSADGSLVYTPTPNVSGIQRLFYHVTDTTGRRSNSPALVVIDVIEVNSPPVVQTQAIKPTLFATEDEALVVSFVPGSTNYDVPFNPINEDTDEEDGFATTGRVVEQPSSGQASFDPDGTFRFVPDPDATGESSFRYVALDSDGAQSVDTARVKVFVVRPTTLQSLPMTRSRSPRTLRSSRRRCSPTTATSTRRSASSRSSPTARPMGRSRATAPTRPTPTMRASTRSLT